MDRMKIIKKRLSMSLQSVRRLDESLSELPEDTGLDEPPLSRDLGENKLLLKLCIQTHTQTHTHTFKASICTLIIVHTDAGRKDVKNDTNCVEVLLRVGNSE